MPGTIGMLIKIDAGWRKECIEDSLATATDKIESREKRLKYEWQAHIHIEWERKGAKNKIHLVVR